MRASRPLWLVYGLVGLAPSLAVTVSAVSKTVRHRVKSVVHLHLQAGDDLPCPWLWVVLWLDSLRMYRTSPCATHLEMSA